MTTGSKLEQSLTSTIFKNWQNIWKFRVFVERKVNGPSKLGRVALTSMENYLFAPLIDLSSVLGRQVCTKVQYIHVT